MDINGQKIDKNLQLSNKVIRISQNLFTNITQPMYLSHLCKELSTINYCPIIVKRQKYKMSIFVHFCPNWTLNSWTKMDINGQKWTKNR